MSPMMVAVAGFCLVIAFSGGFVCGGLWVAGREVTAGREECCCGFCFIGYYCLRCNEPVASDDTQCVRCWDEHPEGTPPR